MHCNDTLHVYVPRGQSISLLFLTEELASEYCMGHAFVAEVQRSSFGMRLNNVQRAQPPYQPRKRSKLRFSENVSWANRDAQGHPLFLDKMAPQISGAGGANLRLLAYLA